MRHTRLVRERDDAASLRDVLDELLNLTNDGLRTVTTAGQLAVTHARFVRSVDMIRAPLLLHDQGLGSAAHPLVPSWTPHDAGHVMQLGRAQAPLPATRRPVHQADRAGERSLCSMRRDPLRAP